MLRQFSNVSEAARRARVSDSAIHTWLAGTSEPGRDKLVALAKAANVSVHWLATGEGEMRPGELSLGGVRSAAQLAGHYLVPRYDIRVGAGPGQTVHAEQIVDVVAFKLGWLAKRIAVDPAKLVLIAAVGDSMRPTIGDGDLLLVDTGQARLRDNAIYVIGSEDDLIVKRLQRRRNGGVLIISDNPRYEREEVPPGEAEMLRVVGRVVWIGTVV